MSDNLWQELVKRSAVLEAAAVRDVAGVKPDVTHIRTPLGVYPRQEFYSVFELTPRMLEENFYTAMELARDVTLNDLVSQIERRMLSNASLNFNPLREWNVWFAEGNGAIFVSMDKYVDLVASNYAEYSILTRTLNLRGYPIYKLRSETVTPLSVIVDKSALVVIQPYVTLKLDRDYDRYQMSARFVGFVGCHRKANIEIPKP